MFQQPHQPLHQKPNAAKAARSVVESIDYQIKALLKKSGQVDAEVGELIDSLLDKRCDYMRRALD